MCCFARVHSDPRQGAFDSATAVGFTAITDLAVSDLVEASGRSCSRLVLCGLLAGRGRPERVGGPAHKR
jgi:hypothetical protein